MLRTNAAETLYYSIRGCAALSLLRWEDERQDVPYEQKLRLEAATKPYINMTGLLTNPVRRGSSKP